MSELVEINVAATLGPPSCGDRAPQIVEGALAQPLATRRVEDALGVDVGWERLNLGVLTREREDRSTRRLWRSLSCPARCLSPKTPGSTETSQGV